MTREERAAQVIAAQRLGFRTQGEIATYLGISRTAVGDALNDPDGSVSRERRKKYQGQCVDCGKPTDGSNGKAKAAKRCRDCRLAYQRAAKHWTRERIIEAIQAFNNEFGRPPSAAEWNPTFALQRLTEGPKIARRWIERNIRGEWPATPTVQAEFGSWNNAIRAAGLTTRKPGERRRAKVKVT